jgi:hypothetical protein
VNSDSNPQSFSRKLMELQFKKESKKEDKINYRQMNSTLVILSLSLLMSVTISEKVEIG